ncbi:MAG: hypothetical protein HYZ20_17275 [Burkholderiales bacterium]|nr:hypothetical protein [Burkholderiales bacterium]
MVNAWAEAEGAACERSTVCRTRATRGRRHPYRAWRLGDSATLQTLLRAGDLDDRDCVGSVIVNAANDRVFETGSRHSALLSLRLVRAVQASARRRYNPTR